VEVGPRLEQHHQLHLGVGEAEALDAVVEPVPEATMQATFGRDQVGGMRPARFLAGCVLTGGIWVRG
jgi:hypothetical protein